MPYSVANVSCSGNFVGAVYEICRANAWTMPTFKDELMSGSLHEPQFKVSCSCHHLRTQGVGRQKKLAKQQAAKEMLDALRKILLKDE